MSHLFKAIAFAAGVANVAALHPASACAKEIKPASELRLYVSMVQDGDHIVYARLVSRHLGDKLPGKPKVRIIPFAGDDGHSAASYVYHRGETDGSALALPVQTMLNGARSSIPYDGRQFRYVGRIASAIDVVWASRSVADAWDVMNGTPIRVASVEYKEGAEQAFHLPRRPRPMSGNQTISGATRSDIAMLMCPDCRAVPGDYHAAALVHAMEGEALDAIVVGLGAIGSLRPGWITIREGAVPVMQFAILRHAALPHVPTVVDLARSDEERRALYAMLRPTTVGRALVAPPTVQEPVIGTLRRAFDEMIADERFLADARQSSIWLDPLPGGQLEALVADTAPAPEASGHLARRR